MPNRSEDLLDDIAQYLAQELQTLGIEKETAISASINAVEKVRPTWGGQQIYLQKALDKGRRQRNEQIYMAFTGNNYGELASQHGVTEMQIRRIVYRVAAERKSQRGGL